MRNVQRSALVPYSAAQMYALVDDIESYPEFLPGCTGAVVHERTDEGVTATLELTKGGMSRRFSTRNTGVAGEAIRMALVDGPFSHLEGEWQFAGLGEDGSRVSLNIDFEFAYGMVDLLFGRFFEQTCNELVAAFTRRAESKYG